jgi:ankyrin repeat protein
VRLLLEHGADVNALNKSGETVSEMGSRHGYHEIVKLLSDYGAESVK